MSGDDGPNAPDGRSAWTRDHAAELRRDETNVTPIIYPPSERLDEDLHVWDTWWLRDRDGSPAEVNGCRVIVALTASSDLLPGKRHDVATLRYFYSTDGKSWETGGRVFEAGMLGSRQWAGSALHDDGDVYVYYTAAGTADEADLSYSQRIALAEGGTISPGDDGDGVDIDGPWDHSVLLEPDGERYEREEQSRGMTYTFRDPWFFEDEDGATYLLFEANTPVPEGSDACGGDAAQQEFNGSVGIAHSPTGDPTDFELRPPLLDAVCVNQELERPHLVVRDGTYYLFVSSHHHTFAPGIEGYDALYGFAADGLRGEYEPLNGHGMVLTNPANAPFQAYSWLAYDHGDELLVTSFFNYFDYDRPSMDDVALLSEDEQMRRFGGTLAPTVRVGLDGRETRILGTLDHGHLPLARESLPADPFAGADDAGGGPRYY
ncbi:glycoside hydrolase family 68 protein [Halogeometricum luteum]|uniref:Glycoside hydrolase family 68 protein n=1 Tax=Halogeometricum luteum TaxID=2950537 RepID=A0ABU2FZI5_9EURY|nr:glycoside hydrolase family 68 protein [Halogeometricum sp. S3BR5-2]MDS0293951.1 glycoside hydrolase family 68 protein [Halogeometricum sp. S3BR5-2]